MQQNKKTSYFISTRNFGMQGLCGEQGFEEKKRLVIKLTEFEKKKQMFEWSFQEKKQVKQYAVRQVVFLDKEFQHFPLQQQGLKQINVNVEARKSLSPPNQLALASYYDHNKKQEKVKIISSRFNEEVELEAVQLKGIWPENTSLQVVFKRASRQFKQKWVQTILRALYKRTEAHSKLRKVPLDILIKILEYAIPGNRYFLRNLNDSHKFFIKTEKKHFFSLQQNNQYLLVNQKHASWYQIKIEKIFPTDQTYQQKIHINHANFFTLINQFKESKRWVYDRPAKKSIFLNGIKFRGTRFEIIKAIIFKLKLGSVSEYFLLASHQSSNFKIMIGPEFDLHILEQQICDKKILGRCEWGLLEFRDQKWWISFCSEKCQQNGSTQIWEGMQRLIPIPLNPSSTHIVKSQRNDSYLQIEFTQINSEMTEQQFR